MNNFEDFFDHSEQPIREAAELLAQARDSLNANQITEQQFKELADDILEIERIEQLGDNLEQKTRIRRGAEQLVSIVSSIV